MAKIRTLKQYNAKYKKTKAELLQFTKKELEAEAKLRGCDVDYLLKGRKWIKIGDTYCEIPRLFSGRWFKHLSAAAKTATCLVGAGIVGSSVGLPVYYNFYYYVKVSDSIDELLPSKDKEFIIENAEISNTLVKLGKDFNTTITLKEKSKEDYAIDNSIVIYVVNNDGTKKKLIENEDYTFNSKGTTAELNVFGKAVTGKLELNINIKEISFTHIVDFNDDETNYDGSEHVFTYALKKERELPEGTIVTFTYNGQEQNEPFSFTNAGKYDVTLKLKHSDYKTFISTKTFTINKVDLPQSEIELFSITNPKSKEGEGYWVEPTIKYSGSLKFESSEFEYSSDEGSSWSSTHPTEYGDYKIKSVLSFDNYNNHTLIGDITLLRNRSTVTFKLPDGAKWSKEGTSEDKSSGEVIKDDGIKFSTYKSRAGIESKPYKQGYKFVGWKDANDVLYEDDTLMGELGDITVTAQFDVVQYDLKLNYRGKGTTETLKVNYGDNLLEKVEGHDDDFTDGAFKGWGYRSDDNDVLDGTETMTDSETDLYSKWYNYGFVFANGEHCTVSGTTTYDPRIKLTYDDFKDSTTFTPDTEGGFKFDEKTFEVYDEDSKLITTITFNDSYTEFKPGKLSTPIKKDCTLTLKPVAVGDLNVAYFNKNGGDVKQSSTSIDKLNINCGDKILTKLNKENVVASHTYAAHIGWTMKKAGQSEESVDENTVMPNETVTLKPVWKTYNVIISCDNGTASISEKNNVIEVLTDDVTITASSGYEFNNKWKYSFDGNEFIDLVGGLPFRPYAISSEAPETVYLKAVCEEIPTKITVFVSAGEGQFADGSTEKTVEINVGGTFADALAIIGEPKKGDLVVKEWKDADGNTITSESVLNSHIIIEATLYGEE